MIDLHLHTTYSDGCLSPADLVQKSYEKGLKVISVTDHDTDQGFYDAKEKSKKLNITVVPGIEFSALQNGELHILGYNINFLSKEFQNYKTIIKRFRTKEIVQILRLLSQNGIEIDMTWLKCTCDAINLDAIIQYMIKHGYIDSIKEGFEKYFSKGKPAYIEKNKLPYKEILAIIKKANGYSVLAHPLRQDKDYTRCELLIREMCVFGLDGIEVFHSSHNSNDICFLKSIAKKYNLYITGGSDYHGNRKNEKIGFYGSGRILPNKLELIELILKNNTGGMNGTRYF